MDETKCCDAAIPPRDMGHGAVGEYSPRARREQAFTLDRRLELVKLAGTLVGVATAAGVTGREWCFLRQAAEMLTDR